MKVLADINKISNWNTQRYQARKRYVQKRQRLLKHWLKGYYYNYMIDAFDLNPERNFSKTLTPNFLNLDLAKQFQRELNQWCYQHRAILDEIQSEKLEELGQWDDRSDQAFKKDKLFVNMMTERYSKDNKHI